MFTALSAGQFTRAGPVKGLEKLCTLAKVSQTLLPGDWLKLQRHNSKSVNINHLGQIIFVLLCISLRSGVYYSILTAGPGCGYDYDQLAVWSLLFYPNCRPWVWVWLWSACCLESTILSWLQALGVGMTVLSLLSGVYYSILTAGPGCGYDCAQHAVWILQFYPNCRPWVWVWLCSACCLDPTILS